MNLRFDYSGLGCEIMKTIHYLESGLTSGLNITRAFKRKYTGLSSKEKIAPRLILRGASSIQETASRSQPLLSVTRSSLFSLNYPWLLTNGSSILFTLLRLLLITSVSYILCSLIKGLLVNICT